MDFNSRNALGSLYRESSRKTNTSTFASGLQLEYGDEEELEVSMDTPVSEEETINPVNAEVIQDSKYEQSNLEDVMVDNKVDNKEEAPVPEHMDEVESEISKYSSIEGIEGIPYSRENQGNPRFKNNKAMEEITFGTEYVAKQLGVSSQAVRNYIEDYNEFLGVKVNQKGRRAITLKQIDKLREIMRIKEERGYTTARMQAFLRDPDNEKKVASPEERMEEMFGKLQLAMQQSMVDSMRAFAGELLDSNTKMIEMRDSINAKVVEELKDQVMGQSAAITELLEVVKSQSRDEKKEKETLQLIEELQKTIEQKDEKVKELTLMVTKQQEEYEYLQKTTRKKIFGLF